MDMARLILVVDDDEQIQRLLAITLEIEGYECAVVDNGYDAIVLVINEAPDLVITDLMMPQMNGYELCRRIREISSIPIIMLTSMRLDRQLRANATAAGASFVMRKPFIASELMARINDLLNN